MKLITLFSLILTIVSSDPGIRLYNEVRKDFYIFKKSERKKKDRKNWVNISNSFKKVQDLYPSSNKADDALYMTGSLLVEAYDRFGKNSDLDSGIEAFEKLRVFYPESRYADDALFIIAESYRGRIKNLNKALQYYELILKKYPQGDQAKKAAYWINYIKRSEKNITKKEFSEKSIEYWSYPSYVRIVINMAEKVPYYYSKLWGKGESGDRIYVDLKYSIFRKGQLSLKMKSGFLKRLRIAQHRGDTVRIVCDLKGEVKEYRVFHFEEPFRIVLDIFGQSQEEIEEDVAVLLPENELNAKPEKKKIRKPVIVVDAGHGGKDPGAIGRRGTKEKNVTLKLAKEVAEILKEKGMKVVLTRKRDVYVPLEERTAIANSVKADIFVSIHANASRSRKARGFETYYFSKTSDRDVLRLAAAENNVRSLRHLSDAQFILYDMVAQYKSNFSKILANYIQKITLKKISDHNKTRNLGAKPGPFFVLKNATMPSVLVETSFISNPKEEKLLNNRAYIKSIAKGIVNGILKYLKEQKKFSI